MVAVEGLGEAVSGGLAARAVEPEAGEGAGRGHACLNCGTDLTGDYCHACGQRAHVHRTLGAFWHDLAHAVLHFEGKFWRTLPMLLWRPGELTRRYIEGQRARFVSPLAMFLFSVFLMFAVFSTLGGKAYFAAPVEGQRGPARARAAEQPAAEIEFKNAPGPLRWLAEPYRKAKANPSLLGYKLRSNAYKFSWVTIPIMVPFVWLLFLHRRRYRGYKAYDHIVFVTYSLSFLSMAAILLTFLKLLGLNGPAALLPLLVPFTHLFRQLRGAYELSVWSALWRTFVLAVLACVAAGLFFSMLLVFGMLG